MEVVVALVFSIVGAIATFRLQEHKNVSAVRASSFVTLIIFGIVLTLSRGQLSDQLITIIGTATFGGSFVGMSSPQLFSNKQIVIGAVFFFLLMAFVLSQYPGLGGSLGFSAFLSCVLVRVPNALKVQS